MMLKQRKSILIWCLILLVLAGLLSGCNAREQAQTRTQELVIGIGRDFYDGPESSNFVHGSTGVWESLTYLNENLEPVPQLAEKLVSDDTGKIGRASCRERV